MADLVLIDGHSILNRAFYGVPDLTNSEGLHTNAVFGFLNIMFRILDEENPSYFIVTFDVKAPTFRHEMFPQYKGTRKPMPEELRQQVPVIQEVLKAMGVCVITKPGFEADDILGTLAYMGQAKGMNVALVSGDRDLLQIATDKIKIRIPKTKGGKTTIEDYYSEDVKKAYNVDPKTFIDLKALMGDTADNIPGVPKIGEKTATELLVQFGSLDNLYEHVEEVSKNSARNTLVENKELAYLSKKLATIDINVPLDIVFDQVRLQNLYTDDAYAYFKRLEFKNLLSRFETSVDYSSITDNFRVIDDFADAEAFKAKIVNVKAPFGIRVIFDKEKDNEVLGVAVSLESETVFIKKWLFISDDWIESFVEEIMTGVSAVYTADLKKIYNSFSVKESGLFKDIIVAAYLLNPLKNDYCVNDIASEKLNLLIPDQKQAFGKKSLSEAMDSMPEEFKNYVCYEAYTCLKSGPLLMDALKEQEMLSLYENIELPLIPVLSCMEKQGIEVVPEELESFSKMLQESIKFFEMKIFKAAGCSFNINSPKQLGEILFEKLHLPGGKKTKTGYSTAADVLEKLSADYPIVKDILDYRAYSKLKSTYADGLKTYIDAENRIHSTFHQTITATGRLSSADPNLQNIPARMELGRQIRKAFVPKKGYLFMDADYSQIELRVLASASEDERLIKAYSEHADIHRITASQVFHVPFEEVTDLQRRNAKAVNFGIVYGISAFGLGEGLNIDRKEAQKYIEDYFLTYPKIKKYLDSQVEMAKERGYVVTYYGRRRPVPELSSSNFMQRQFGERVAMNSPIQGTAADIIKIAMIRVYRRLLEENLESKLILQVHDELLIETKEEEKDIVEKILREEMVEATDLAVKMEIDLHMGKNWLEAK